MKRKKLLWFWVWILFCLLLCLGAEIWHSNFRLTVRQYQVENPKITAPLRIVHLSDLHCQKFGEDNRDLISLVQDQQPDLILLTGDMVTGREKDTATALELIAQLRYIAPVYASLGNHERTYDSLHRADIAELYRQAGAVVLEYAYQDVEISGQALRIGGASGYCLPDIYLATGEAKTEECEFLKDFQSTDHCTLLMSHLPVSWIQNDAISYWDTDLVFSGHVHGGQIKLPLLGPVYAPDMGWFPGRLEGVFFSGNESKALILSTGLGSSLPIPRLNNPPQVVVVDILPKA